MDTHETAGTFLGLGYAHHDDDRQMQSSSSAADSLMKHYMQQCLDFHAEQARHAQNQDSLQPQFVAAQHSLEPHVDATTASSSSDRETVPSVVSINPLADASAQAAIAKARAIVQKFQTTHQHQFPCPTSTSPSDYRHRREQQLQLERQRLHRATLKNLEYVARREEERLQLQLAQLQETKTLEQQLQQKQAALLRERHQTALSSKAGIGTSRRQALEQTKQRKGHVVVKQKDTVAIYLSGLPVDGSMTQDAVGQLFASYGSIRRVHFYRNKETGQLKGDALIVYNIEGEAEADKILDSACLQMNGAELPCGSILHVEPADPQHKQSRGVQGDQSKATCSQGAKSEDVGYYGPSSSPTMKTSDSEPKAEKIATGSNHAEEKDLDDFFESLT